MVLPPEEHSTGDGAVRPPDCPVRPRFGHLAVDAVLGRSVMGQWDDRGIQRVLLGLFRHLVVELHLRLVSEEVALDAVGALVRAPPLRRRLGTLRGLRRRLAN